MRAVIRSLRRGELPPEGVSPRRYKNSGGYVRLRWRVGPFEQVECYEHRWVAGCLDPELHVHHKNHVRDDNRPENLEVVGHAEHGVRHRSPDRQRVLELYASGLSTPEVGRLTGHHAATVFHMLASEGVAIRPGSSYQVIALDQEAIRSLHTAGVRNYRIAKTLGVSVSLIDKHVRLLGLTSHREGRPTNAEIRSAEEAIAAYRERVAA